MIKILIAISVIVIILATRSTHAQKRREKSFAENFPKFRNLVNEGKYSEALEMLETIPVLKWRYKLEPAQRKEITEIETDCLEKLNKIPEAVISLATHLSAVYEVGKWPQDLLSRWISLYKSCHPLDIDKFYFCQSCGLHPETKALLKYAIEKEGCSPPVGFPGKKGSSVIVEWGSKKFRNKEK